jgi:hypothetical protein
MKKLFVPIVALATVFVFTDCKSDIKITIPDGDLTIDLGDRTKALEGVSAKGKKDIPKEDITIVGLDFVGKEVKLTYTAKEESETETQERKVSIKPDKLFGQYVMTETDASGPTSYPVTVEKDPEVGTVNVCVKNIYNNTTSWIFVGDGKTMELKPIKTYKLDEGTDDEGTVTASLKYAIVGGKYRIISGSYSIEWAKSQDESYTLTFAE